MRKKSITSLFIGCLFLLTGFPEYSYSQSSVFSALNYPTRPIEVIVPFARGGPTDILTRTVSEKMSQILGQPIQINNVSGDGGTTGVLNVGMSEPDGYTLVVGNQGTHASAPTLYEQDLKYDPYQDFEPIGVIASTPLYVVIRKGFMDDNGNPITEFQQLIQYLRNHPRKTMIGHSGRGSTSHLAALYFMSLTKTDMIQIPYKGSAPALKDLSSGLLDMMCDQSASVIPYIQEGVVLPILYGQRTRSKASPDTPSAEDIGLREFELDGWNILFAPRGVDAEIIKKVNTALLQALADPEIQAQMTKIDAIIYETKKNKPSLVKDFLRKEITRWASIVRVANQLIENDP